MASEPDPPISIQGDLRLSVETHRRHGREAAWSSRCSAILPRPPQRHGYSPPQSTCSAGQFRARTYSHTTPWLIQQRLALVGEESVSGVTGGTATGANQEHQPMRIYIIGNDGITLCREMPAAKDGPRGAASREVPLQNGQS